MIKMTIRKGMSKILDAKFQPYYIRNASVFENFTVMSKNLTNQTKKLDITFNTDERRLMK